MQRRLNVRVPLAVAWEHLARVERWPSWARHIRRISLDPRGGIGPATEGVIVLRTGLRSKFRVKEFEPGVRWMWSGRALGLRIDYDHRFRAVAPDETEIGLVVDAEGLWAGTLGRLFARLYAAQLDRALPRLKKEVEAAYLRPVTQEGS